MLKRKTSSYFRLVLCLLIINSFMSSIIYNNILQNIPPNNSNSDKNLKTSANPIVIVNSPMNYSLFGKTATNYSITISGDSLNYTWYEFLDTGETSDYIALDSISSKELNEPFNQDLWNNLDNGTVHIRYYVNNSLGEIGYNDTIIRIDIIDPDIEIITPTTGYFNSTPPDFIIDITEANLNQTWYTLNINTTKHFFEGNGAINYTAWNYENDGNIDINFFANDTVANEDSKTVQVIKDTVDPVVSITSPTLGVYDDTPDYEISISEVNLYQYWYTLNGGPRNYISSQTGTLNVTDWDNQVDGVVEIIFYAEDDAGHIGSDSVSITKDTVDPVVSITLPSLGVYDDAPDYEITITELNLYQYWYTLNGGPRNYISSQTSSINSTDWDNQPDGVVEIIFYAEDDAGHIGSDSVSITKDTVDPVVSITLPSVGVYDTVPDYEITITELNLYQYWYTLNGGPRNYISSQTGTLNVTDWDNQLDGAVEIIFSAEDDAGHIGSDSVSITKDTVDPVVSITSPTIGVYDDAPDYEISITEVNLYQYWYTLNGGPRNYISSQTGTLNVTDWDNQPDGVVGIIFYAEDDAGHIGSDSISITKDTVDPVVSITLPSVGVYDDAPDYEISITEVNLYQYWYTLNGGPRNYISSQTGTLNVTDWDNQLDGVVEIIFYAEDDAGHIGSNSISITKDTVDPVVSITLPSVGVYDTAPDYEITIIELNLYQYWYTLNGGPRNYILSTTGTINSTDWDNQPDEVVEIIFYAEDDIGHIGSDSVSITKDTVDPIVSITLPNSGVYDDIPDYEINITEVNLYQYWYTLNGGPRNYISSQTGTLNVTDWDNQPDGVVEIIFYAEDNAGHIGSDSISITKDTVDPIVSITLPSVGVYDNAPDYEITITELNLYQYWYTLNGGPRNYIFSQTGSINSTDWDNQPDGVVEIIFYAEDDAGHIGSDSVSLTKDTVDPAVSITSPTIGVYDDAPNYEITITELNLYQYWYTLNGGPLNYIFSQTGSINSTDWNNQPDGVVEIIFYAEDDAEHIGSDSISITKDTVDPVVSITLPSVGVYDTAPEYEITIIELNLYQYWYTLNGGPRNYIFSQTGSINSTDWDNQPDGVVEIIFYAEDDAGHIGSDSVSITKDTVDPIVSITLPTSGVYDDAPDYEISITELNLYQYWYTLNGGPRNYISSQTGPLNVTDWDNQPDGAVELIFYAEDNAEHIGSDSVSITKDTVDPVVSITLPSVGVYDDAPDYEISITEVNLYQYWYTLDGGPRNYISSQTGTVNVTYWDNQSDGVVGIIFYAEDDAGHIGSDSVSITKDTVDPVVSITLPSVGVYDTATDYEITITELNLYQYWYTLNGGPRNYISSQTGTLNVTDWNIQPDGVVEIIFYAEDDAGHIGSDSVSISKDSIAPGINDFQLGDDTWRNVTGTVYDVDFYDSAPSSNLDYAQYIITSEMDLGGIIMKDWTYIFTDLGLNSYSLNWSIDFIACQEGYNYISVRVYDKAGNFASFNDVFYVKKDTISPTIIDSQVGDDNWRDTSGTIYDVDFSDSLPSSNLSFAQYKITSEIEQGGIILKDWTYIFQNLGIPSYTTDWSIDFAACKEGINYISVKAYDEAGNFQIVNDIFYVKKDTTAPILVINNPNNNSYYNSPPPINITIYELNPSVPDCTYTVIGYSPIELDNNTQVNLDQDIWDSLSEGEFQIQFTSYDIFGRRTDLHLNLLKDSIAPKVSINLPINNSYYNSAPFLNITAFDPNFDNIWYSVNNINIPIVNNTQQQLDSSIWNSLPAEGEFQVKIFANDSFGHINDKFALILFKDVLDPRLNIVNPLNNTYWKFPPSIQVIVHDPNFENLWYRIGTNIRSLSNDSLLQIDFNIWDNLPDECEFNIFLYANDTASNINDIYHLTLYKDIIGPRIAINYPNNDDLFGDIPPDYDITIIDPNINQTWYTIIGGSFNVSFVEWSGTLDQTLWEELEEETITIRFYANDTLNNIGFTDVIVRKNLDIPIITLNSPADNDLYGIDPPGFAIYKSGYELNTTWYTLDSGDTNYTFTELTGAINQDAWNMFGYGYVTIQFYINDSLGRIGYDYVTIRKDPNPPLVSINLIDPAINNSYCASEPTFEVSVYEPNLDSIWYQVGGEIIFITNNTENQLSGTIWENLPQGTFVIEIYAKDSLGYVNDPLTIVLKKDTIAPILKINQPLGYYYNAPPSINISVFDPNFFSLTYTVIGYVPDTIWLENNSQVPLNLGIWNALPQGEFLVSLTAYDSFYHYNNSVILTLYKDTTGPIIDVLMPDDMTYHNSPPTLKMIAHDPNLHTLWYRIGSESRELLNNTDQILDSSIWNGLAEGEFSIEFLANDTFGANSISVYLTLIKDTINPQISIYSPTNNTYYSSSPMLNINAFDLNLDKIWYTINENIFFLSGTSEPLNEELWNNLPQGQFDIYLFSNDTATNLNNSIMLTLFKDTLAPTLVINSPANNSYWELWPIMNVIGYDVNSMSIYYKVLEDTFSLGNNTYSDFNHWSWYNLPEGFVTVEFYAVDSLGNTGGSIFINLCKDTTDPEINIIQPQYNDIFGEIAPNFEISVLEDNLDATWYTLVGTSLIFLFTGSTGSINQTAWETFGNVSVTIRFFANDTASNSIFKDVIVRKNIFAPIINIVSPEDNNRFGIEAPSFTIYKSGAEIQATWYTLDGGITNFTFTGLTGAINQIAWNAFDSEMISIRFYINDSFGKIGYDDLVLVKDQDAPLIIVNSPYNHTAFAQNPLLNLSIIDSSLDKVWYTLDGNILDITSNWTFFLDLDIWNTLPQGLFTINFLSNDTVGNLNSLEILLSKDTLGPNISVIKPSENQAIGRESPYFELTITDANSIADSWYTIDGGLDFEYFIGSVGKIDQALWESVWDNTTQGGAIILRFYARDNLGNTNFIEITITKYVTGYVPKFLSEPLGFFVPTIALVALLPLTFRLTKTRYYKSLNSKEKSKLGKVLISVFFFLSLIILFYAF